MTDTDTFHAELIHDGVRKSADLPVPSDNKAPARIRVHAIDSSGSAVIDVFILVDSAQWPAAAGYAYLGSITD